MTPQHVVEPLDLLVAVGQVEVDALVFLQLVAGRVGDGQAKARQALLLGGDAVIGELFRLEHQADVFDTHLPDEGKGLVALDGANRDLRAHRHSWFLLCWKRALGPRCVADRSAVNREGEVRGDDHGDDGQDHEGQGILEGLGDLIAATP